MGSCSALFHAWYHKLRLPFTLRNNKMPATVLIQLDIAVCRHLIFLCRHIAESIVGVESAEVQLAIPNIAPETNGTSHINHTIILSL
ncbi:MAG TPA: hypothetical protein VIK55_04390 [Paludibacter sp.]